MMMIGACSGVLHHLGEGHRAGPRIACRHVFRPMTPLRLASEESMKPDEAFSDLIGSIYDCALDMSLWPATLGEITEALGGVMADLIVSHPLERAQTYAVHYNWPEDQLALAI